MADNNRTLWTLLGLTAGAATGFWLWRRGSGSRSIPEVGEPLEPPSGDDAAERIARAYAADLELGLHDLEVHAISQGVVELRGAVTTREQRDRAVAVAHNAADVHTVVNRLVVETEEARLEANRVRNEDEPIHHSGMGVGMGTRRQSPDTDPDRPSDRQKLLDRELEVRKMEVEVGDGAASAKADEAEGPDGAPPDIEPLEEEPRA